MVDQGQRIDVSSVGLTRPEVLVLKLKLGIRDQLRRKSTICLPDLSSKTKRLRVSPSVVVAR